MTETSKCPNKVLEYIRTLFPVIISILAVIFFVKDMQRSNDVTNAVQDQRLEIIEECQQDMQTALGELREAQDITNQNMATLNTGVNNLNNNVARIIEILDSRY